MSRYIVNSIKNFHLLQNFLFFLFAKPADQPKAANAPLLGEDKHKLSLSFSFDCNTPSQPLRSFDSTIIGPEII